MNRLITADAYKWVYDRAEHIREENPDIDESESYGIAWKQYKKDHPKWKSKREKEKKKKKASRLRYAWRNGGPLENKQDDNSDLYYQVDSLMDDIRSELDKALEVGHSFKEVDTIEDAISNISANASAIYDCADTAKGHGISNEHQLSIGKDQIQELERDLSELESDLEDILSENEDLRSEIQDVQDQIDSIQEELARLSSELTAAEQHGIIHEEKKHTFICHAHDSIMKWANEITQECDSVTSKISDAMGNADGSNDDEISDVIHDIVIDLENEVTGYMSSIESDLQETRQMNNNMGTGIEKKNERIEELTTDIENKQNELQSAEDQQGDLKSELSSLKSSLNQLDNELSNIGG